MPAFILIVVVILSMLAGRPALKAKSWNRFFVGFVLSFFGILLPLVFFFLSAFLVPEAKDECPHGWLDCFYMGKLALTPFVLWATAALYAVEIYEIKDRTRPWIVQGFFVGAIVSSVCAVFGLVSKGNELPLLLVVPFYTAVWYVLRAVQLIQAAKITASPLVKTATSSLPFWAASVFWSYNTYLSLPDHFRPDCFVVTAASRGHRKFVGPFREVPHRGQTRLANQQLITLWQLEALWRTHDPRSHAVFRRAYNIIGPIIARRITAPLIADALYIALKPAELLARLFVHVITLRQQPRTPQTDVIQSGVPIPKREILLPLRHEVGERVGERWCLGFRGKPQAFRADLKNIADRHFESHPLQTPNLK
jgi:hypothetical protein